MSTVQELMKQDHSVSTNAHAWTPKVNQTIFPFNSIQLSDVGLWLSSLKVNLIWPTLSGEAKALLLERYDEQMLGQSRLCEWGIY